jgi:DNA-binding response OmpR family regulator
VRVLIADDEADVVKVVRFRLAKQGYEVLIAVDGKQALETIRKVKPDLVLLDFRMPFLNGDEVCREIKASGDLKHIPIILMTASLDNVTDDKRAQLKADDYILKPFEADNLLAKVRKFIRRESEEET